MENPMKNRTTTLALACLAACAALAAIPAQAHDAFTSMYATAGYNQDLEMRVSHGCKGSAVNQLRIKIPDEVSGVMVEYRRDWKVETKMRKLAQPMMIDGRTVTEVVDEIIWSAPRSSLPAAGVFEGFKFRARLPDSPGKILFFKTITGCEQGDDKYIDLPKTALDIKDADFPKKIWAFMTATSGPAPFVILEKASRGQYPWAGVDTNAKPASSSDAH
jgi:uncharacterized protein YcnI